MAVDEKDVDGVEDFTYNYVKPSEQLEDNWLFWWVLKNWKVSSGEFAGNDYTFMPFYPFLEAYVKDRSPKKVAMKSAQAGVTEINVAHLFATADNLPGNCLYALPTIELAATLSRSRIKNVIPINPYLEERLTGFDTMHQFKFRDKFVYIRGANVTQRDGREFQRHLISIDISKLWGDEVDEWNHGVRQKLVSRLGASLDPYESYFSTPRLSRS